MSQATFRILGISHVGLAPKDPEQSIRFFRDTLGVKLLGSEHVADQNVDTTMFASTSDAANAHPNARLEILKHAGDAGGPIASFLEKKGGGIHHLAIQVDNIANVLATLKEHNVKLIDEQPRLGAGGCQIAFIHPHATGGLLIELTQEPMET